MPTITQITETSTAEEVNHACLEISRDPDLRAIVNDPNFPQKLRFAITTVNKHDGLNPGFEYIIERRREALRWLEGAVEKRRERKLRVIGPIQLNRERADGYLADQAFVIALEVLGRRDVLKALRKLDPKSVERGFELLEDCREVADELAEYFRWVINAWKESLNQRASRVSAWSDLRDEAELLNLMQDVAAERFAGLRGVMPTLPSDVLPQAREFIEKFWDVLFFRDELLEWSLEAQDYKVLWPQTVELLQHLEGMLPDFEGDLRQRCRGLIRRLSQNWFKRVELEELVQKANEFVRDPIGSLRLKPEATPPRRRPEHSRGPQEGAKARGVKGKGKKNNKSK
ncbi:MAG TPA: hypothetical protein VLE72_00780 [Candidatus Saccharimonadales bacterium]|nr:hypothetical protein [Candidatus Saccharimonadales bacterium]